ncbi:nucleoside triphosphate hydrolase [Rhizobium sp. NLR9b]|uniref:nucleoside triphosphate hydrolase n=1 Tax=Rhizobium TaxID=379 RepID=UPI001C83F879|nr:MULTISPECIES: nucleoside triphosphate hydrolase [Rhizobium]MBX5155335.1 nucleoside triphosphate hydrolase [Rhizobium lentis]MBX5179743.1 nucleoside triphosphate hydrolase [Rhizobium lentis]MBX5230024.1 nucleoside triphosphate hydrolase [Rhizobium sp. NLR9b]MBX5290691.1 nucleoside triphosphate hydrolase [Rhizobium sp. NLR10b]
MSKIDENAQKIAEIAVQRFAENGGRRVLIAIAGAPGSGKSTLAERSVEAINSDHHLEAALFPLDGFHYDDAVLEQMGRRPYKGAIDTFDVHGLRHMLKRLKANEDDVVAVPVFDRSIEIARAGGNLIPRSTKIIVCEGNYLLARQAPWDKLKEIFDFTAFVDVDEDHLRQRLQNRWRSYGLDPAEIRRKVEENDLPNGLAIVAGSAEPDLHIENN